jgi:hypothetical protein
VGTYHQETFPEVDSLDFWHSPGNRPSAAQLGAPFLDANQSAFASAHCSCHRNHPYIGSTYSLYYPIRPGSCSVSILLANSIVQDGHGALPLFAESRSSFFLAKGIKLIPALIVVYVVYGYGFEQIV